MIGSYRTLGGVAGGFLLAALIIAGASLAGVTQQTSSADTKPRTVGTMAAATRSANQSSSLSSPNNITSPGSSPPVKSNGTSNRQAAPSQSSLNVISKAGGYSLLLTLTPLLAAVILGVIVYRVSARRTERTG